MIEDSRGLDCLARRQVRRSMGHGLRVNEETAGEIFAREQAMLNAPPADDETIVKRSRRLEML
ncbi:hypothetical protein [Burkholderia sp. ABCPW 11]|uniref:hypothetical protein n=1 Tax=Burkholderia sp. ABCPW 11 TaxID=1637859 RepID=UPI000A6FBE9C|nr:hypothetical protein [Burkholderia sp. ABCPW 11]